LAQSKSKECIMDDRSNDWPVGESSGAPVPYSAEAGLSAEGADWGLAARAVLLPHLRYREQALALRTHAEEAPACRWLPIGHMNESD
jgi:hypothetical protein